MTQLKQSNKKTKICKEIDVAKSNSNEEYIICHYLLFNYGFKFQDSICNSCMM